MSVKIGNDGRIVFSAFLGPYSSYPEDSEERHAAFSRSVQSTFDRMQFAHPERFATLLVRAVKADYKPWEHWPEEAKGSPDEYFRLVIGCSWAEARQVVIGQGGKEGLEWCAVIDEALARWEAEHRTVETQSRKAGRFTAGSDTSNGESRDHVSATGIRRRLQKRANAGDEQAAALIEDMRNLAISPNAAAIAAGMREKYIRISPSPHKAAKSLAFKKGQEWCLQLMEELSSLIIPDC